MARGYIMTALDQAPAFLFGKIYEWSVNDEGNLVYTKQVITDADREEFGAQVDALIEENTK